MKRNKNQRLLLRIAFIINLFFLIPILLRKPPIKDWIIVYLFNAVSNGIIDKVITKYKLIKYPVKLLPKLFDIHILFDFLFYPTFSVLYNQMTYKDGLFPIIYKLILFTTPPFLIEYFTEKKTNLIKWSNGWKWYHTFGSLILQSLITRTVIEVIRKADKKEQNKEKQNLKQSY